MLLFYSNTFFLTIERHKKQIAHTSKMPESSGGWHRSSWEAAVPTAHFSLNICRLPFQLPFWRKNWVSEQPVMSATEMWKQHYSGPFSTRGAMSASPRASFVEFSLSSSVLWELTSVPRQRLSSFSFLPLGPWKSIRKGLNAPATDPVPRLSQQLNWKKSLIL